MAVLVMRVGGAGVRRVKGESCSGGCGDVRYQAHAFDNQCLLANEQPNEQLCEASIWRAKPARLGRSIHPLAASLDRSLHVCAREFAGTRLASRLRGCESCSQNTIVARKAPAKDYQRGRITAQLCVLQDLLTRAGKLSADRLQNTARPQSQSLNAAAATQQCASPSAAAAWNTSGPAP